MEIKINFLDINPFANLKKNLTFGDAPLRETIAKFGLVFNVNKRLIPCWQVVKKFEPGRLQGLTALVILQFAQFELLMSFNK